MSASTEVKKTDEKPNNNNRSRRNEEERFSKLKANMRPKDLQKSQVEKLMAEPEKPVDIPEKNKEWRPPDPPEFKRFYMGSSAGAGSEVFHVYRHLRRYEMIRQQWISETAEKEDKDSEFQQRLAEKKAAMEEKTAKKRAKRLKKKQRSKGKKESGEDGGGAREGGKTEMNDDSEEEENEYENPFVIGGK